MTLWSIKTSKCFLPRCASGAEGQLHRKRPHLVGSASLMTQSTPHRTCGGRADRHGAPGREFHLPSKPATCIRECTAQSENEDQLRGIFDALSVALQTQAEPPHRQKACKSSSLSGSHITECFFHSSWELFADNRGFTIPLHASIQAHP